VGHRSIDRRSNLKVFVILVDLWFKHLLPFLILSDCFNFLVPLEVESPSFSIRVQPLAEAVDVVLIQFLAYR
jgi:hypothetical protein